MVGMDVYIPSLQVFLEEKRCNNREFIATLGYELNKYIMNTDLISQILA
jgi:hypothetical protein